MEFITNPVTLTYATFIGIFMLMATAIAISMKREGAAWDLVEHDLSEAQVQRRLNQLTQN